MSNPIVFIEQLQHSYLLKSFLSVTKRHEELIQPITPVEGLFFAPAPLILLTCGVRDEEGSNGEEEFRCNTSTESNGAQTFKAGGVDCAVTWLRMSATRYRRFLKLCEEWPRDETKKGRDLGTFLRQRVASAFREGENTQVEALSLAS